MSKVNKIKPEVREAIKRKSAFSLPDSPGSSGYKPEDIRRALYRPIIDETNSLVAEVDRLAEEVNRGLEDTLKDVDTSADKKLEEILKKIPSLSVTQIDGGYRITVKGESGEEFFDVMNGKDGEDGESTSASKISVKEIDGGYRFTVTDGEESQSFDIMNGVDGVGADDFYITPDYGRFCYQFRSAEEFSNAEERLRPSNASFVWNEEEGAAVYETSAKNNWLQIADSVNGIAEGSKYKFFKIRYRLPPTTLEDGHIPYASMYWRTYDVRGDNAVDPIEDGKHNLVPYGSRYKTELIADDKWHDLVYDLSSHANWDGGLIIVLRWQFSFPVEGPIYIEQFGLFETADEAYEAEPRVSIERIYNMMKELALKGMDALEGCKLPSVTAEDNNKFLMVVNGEWAAVSILSAEGEEF